MMVSAIRSAYETDTHFFKDSNATSRVLWYFVSDDTPALPFPTVFSDTVWSERNNEVQSHLGEVQTGHVYSKGFPPASFSAPATVPCGTADQWLNGASIADPIPADYPGSTLPVCCPESLTFANPGGQSEGRLSHDLPSPCDLTCIRPDQVYAQVTNIDNFACIALNTVIPLNVKSGDWELDPTHYAYMWESPVFPWGTATATLAVLCNKHFATGHWVLKDPLDITNSSVLFLIGSWVCEPLQGVSVGSSFQPPGCAWIMELTFFP